MNSIIQLTGKEKKKVLGLMSGTSMDGIDVALIQITGSGLKTQIQNLGYFCEKYQKIVVKRLEAISNNSSLSEISELNNLVGEEFARAAINASKTFSISLDEIDMIGSHGQKIYHNPPSRKLGVPSTLQIGDIDIIAERTGILTVGDFRSRDIASGGEGAPIISYVDYILFSKDNETLLTQNIGGIANVTLVSRDKNEMIAFDTGPGNMLMDGIIKIHSKGKSKFDKYGETASKGDINKTLLNNLLSDKYYVLRPPKSTGAEKFGEFRAKELYKLYLDDQLPLEDLMRTVLELTVESIATSYEQFIFPAFTIRKVILSGGGSNNKFLVERLKQRLSSLSILLSDQYNIPHDAKEAIGIAILANELVSGNCSNIPSCTGARRYVPLGKLSLGR